MGAPRKYPLELKERAVRLVFESGRPVRQVARDLGVHHESLRVWVRQGEADSGRRRDLLTTDEREELKRLRKENVELRRANAILKDASVYFATSSTRPGEGEPLRGGAAGRFRGRADLRGDGRAGEHVLRGRW
jgi:transposase